MGRDSLPWEIAETSMALRRAYDRRVARLGVTRAQWRVLLTLSRNPGLRQVDLAERLDMEPITLCRIVDRLEEANLVERQRDPADRRAWRLALTDQSAPMLENLREIATEMADDTFGGLDPFQIETLRSMLEQIRGNIARTAPLAKKAPA